MNISDFNRVEFLAGAATLDSVPYFDLPEFAFVGRSNVGKSSLINALVNSKIARVSNTPGRTQQINFFKISNSFILADLPGYGYAKVSKETKKNWNHLIVNYLRGRVNLRRVFLLIDSRHGYKETDSDILKFLSENAVSFETILTKIDKEQHPNLQSIEEKNQTIAAAYPKILSVSSETKQGIEELKKEIIAAVEF